MNKKSTSIFLLILYVFILFGCVENTEAFKQPVRFFYPERVKEDGSITNVISFEIREGEAFGDDLQLLLNSYFAGPNDATLYSPFPAYTKLLEASFSQGKVTLRFDESFADLSSLDRTIACASISQTCMAFTGAEAVEIFAENILFDGMESILITHKNLLIQDNSPIAEP